MEAKVIPGQPGQMPDQHEDDDDVRFRLRQQNTLKKAKSKKLRKVERKLDARQYALLIIGVFLILWGLVVTFLLINLGVMYNFGTVPTTREEYSVKGAAEWAKSVASEDLMQAIEVWNIINASITGLVYRAPTDYTNLGNVLSPAFDTLPALHAVELTFSDRPSQVSLTRQKGVVVRGSSSFMQSTSADCFLMGVEGCVDKPMFGARPYWFNMGNSLPASPYGGGFSWWSEPELVVESSSDGGDTLWPAIRLVFKHSFPTFHDSLGRNTFVVGRITVKLSELGGSRLVDKRLGEDGSIYLCDSGGVLMASQNVFDVLDVVNGRVQFKHLLKVGEDWTAKAHSAFHGGNVDRIQGDADGAFVAVEPLSYPLNRFAVVVVAPSRMPFQNDALVGTLAIAFFVAPAPYAITLSIAGMLVIWQCVASCRQSDGKVEANAPKGAGGRRVSITDTMSGVQGIRAATPKRTSFREKLRGMTKDLSNALTGQSAAH